MNEIQSFLTATERCVAQSKTMLSFEQEKRQALLSDDLTRLESMIQAQQAAIMKMESLEKQRLEAQEKAGYHNLSASEILALLGDSPDRAILARQISELKLTLEEIRYHNEKAMEIARANLQVVEKMSAGAARNDQQGVYRPKPSGGADFQGGSSFETKI